MRRALALSLAVSLLAGATLAWAQAQRNNLAIVTVVTCGTTIGTLIGANPNRTNLTLINVGTIHAGVAGNDVSNAALAARGFATLHTATAWEWRNFTGGLTCTAAGPVGVQVIEEFP